MWRLPFEAHLGACVAKILHASGMTNSVYAGTSGDGAENPFMMGLTATPQLQPQTAPASKSPTSTPARVNKDKVFLAACLGLSAYRTCFALKNVSMTLRKPSDCL